MLLRQNFRGGHHGRLPAASAHHIGRCRRHCRLAGANVPLHQPVHGPPASQVAADLLHRPFLRPGHGKGQQGGKPFRVRHAPRGGKALLPLPQQGKAQRQGQKLLKGQPAARRGKALKILREMDMAEGGLHVRQFMGLPHFFRQSLFHGGEAAGQCLPHQSRDQVVGDSRRQGVHRKDAPGGLSPARRFDHGVRHGKAAPASGHRAVKNIRFTGVQGVVQIALVEKRHGHGRTFVHHLHPGDVQSLPNAGKMGHLRHNALYAHRDALRRLSNGAYPRPVLIGPGVVAHQVPRLRKAQLGELARSGLPDPRKVRQWRIPSDHAVFPPFLHLLFRYFSSSSISIWGMPSSRNSSDT